MILPREGVIIEWPLKWQFHDPNTDVLTSRTDVREMQDNDNHHEQTLVNVLNRF